MCWFFLVIGLNFIGESIGNVNLGKVDGDEETAVVIGGVASSAFDPSVP